MINREILGSLFGDEPRHTPQNSNASTWQANMVELVDGRVVRSDSPLWIAECEARTILSWSSDQKAKFFEMIDGKRGAGSSDRLKRLMEVVEPSYVLSLPTKDQRQTYLAMFEKRTSRIGRERLQERILELWRKRQAKLANNASPEA